MTSLHYIDSELTVNFLRSNIRTKQHSKVVGISILGQIYDPPSQCFLSNSGFRDVSVCPGSAVFGCK